MSELEKYCKGLADINRLRILNLLMRGELCGCDIQYVLDVVATQRLAASAVSEEFGIGPGSS